MVRTRSCRKEGQREYFGTKASELRFSAKDPKEMGIRVVKEKSDKHFITLLVPSSMGSFSSVKPEKYDQNVSS